MESVTAQKHDTVSYATELAYNKLVREAVECGYLRAGQVVDFGKLHTPAALNFKLACTALLVTLKGQA
jgi:hypothetical protein